MRAVAQAAQYCGTDPRAVVQLLGGGGVVQGCALCLLHTDLRAQGRHWSRQGKQGLSLL